MTRASAFALIVIAAELISAWLFGLCTNKLFLFFLATAAVTLTVAVPRATLITAALPFVVALILTGRLWDKPTARHVSFNKNVIEIPKGGFRYAFDLEPLVKERRRCQSSDTKLVIHGKNLERVKIDLNGVEQTHARIESFLGVFDHLFLDLPSEITQFSVTASRGEDGPIPSIYVGPQFRDNSLYAEAVFVVSENAQCRLTLHSRRSCGEKCPEILQSLSYEVLKSN